MKTKLSTENLARFSGKHPWITILIWIFTIVLAVYVSANYLGDALTMDSDLTNEPESKKADEIIEKRFPDFDKVQETIVIDSDIKVDDPAYQQFVTELQNDITSLDKDTVEGVFSYYQTGDPSMVSEDKQATVLPLIMAEDSDKAVESIESVQKIIKDADKDKQFTVKIIGDATLDKDFQEVSEKDLQTGEFYGILVALVILALVFVSLVATSIPIVLAIVAIVASVGATALLGQAFDFSFFIVNMITMMGLAVGIDYSLFIISRFREERNKGVEVLDAITNAGATASRAVLFSGITVILALLGMLIVPSTVFKSLATGAILVVIFSVMASLTLLPAVLRLLGDKVNSVRIPFLGRRMMKNEGNNNNGFWNWVTRKVMNHPVKSLLITVGILIVFTLPLVNINLGSDMGAGSLPDNLQSKEAYQILEDKFSAGETTPALIVIDGETNNNSIQKSIKKLKNDLAKDDLYGPANLIENPKNNYAYLEVPIISHSDYDKSVQAVEKIRNDYVPEAFSGSTVDVFVTGPTAGSLDFTDIVYEYMPIVLLLVLSMSFILLTLVFRSLVVPLKAIVMNLLSVGSAYGLMVLVFQKGVGAELLGFQQVEVIESWIPLFLFSVLFGLSMDYHVFLLSRIREHYNQTGDNGESVAFGLRSTGRIITGAAVIMVAVFSGFAAGDMVMFQQMGFGLAVAVFLDATIIRTILVPASMKLLGKRNWYLPKVLDWLPEIKVEGSNEELLSKNTA